MIPPSHSRSLRRRPSLLHPFFRRAPQEGTAGLRNSASRDPVRERGDQVFGERPRATADSDDYFSDDDFFPDVGSLSINDMGDTNTNTSGSTPAAQYVICCSVFEIMLHVVFLAIVLDVISLSTVLVDRMASLICFIISMDCLSISWIKSYAK